MQDMSVNCIAEIHPCGGSKLAATSSMLHFMGCTTAAAAVHACEAAAACEAVRVCVQTCDDLEDEESLKHLYHIMKGAVMLNNNRKPAVHSNAPTTPVSLSQMQLLLVIHET